MPKPRLTRLSKITLAEDLFARVLSSRQMVLLDGLRLVPPDISDASLDCLVDAMHVVLSAVEPRLE